jgi:molecular chaperone GrpE
LAEAAEVGEVDLQQQVRDLQDQLLRSRAELENVRKRMRREMETDRKYAALPLLQDLVGVVDNLQRALQAAHAAGNDEMTQGVEMVSGELQRVLDRHGCQPVAELGDTFDPNFHEAIAQQPSDEYPAGSVMYVHQLGYQLHDRVVRPAQVIVSSGPAADAAPPPMNESGDRP